jgi:hypothetical protein
MMACQYAMQTSLKKMEPNSGEKEAIVERQKIPNEEVAVHSLWACQNETTTACHEVTETDTEKTETDPGMMHFVAKQQ